MFSIIVACDSKNGIGKNGTLPWRLKGDMKYFSEVTKKTTLENEQNVVIMGRKTFESIPEKFRPLPNRHNIIITRNQHYDPGSSVVVAHSLEEAIIKAYEFPNYDNFFIIGGAQIYNEAFKHGLLMDIHLTQVKGDFNCDTFIEFNTNNMQLIASQDHKENDVEYNISLFRNGRCC
jgi:dihydrofolate reductase